MPILKYSDTLRNNQVGQIETTIGTTPVMRLFAGTIPANCAAADVTPASNLIAEINLPSDWLGAPGTPTAGSVALANGPWQDTSANNTGTLTHFRVYNSGATVCHMQGDITLTGGGGAMTVDNTNVQTGQQISINTFQITAGNA